DATPVARWAFALPFYDKFRVGAPRHGFLEALGCASLAGMAIAWLQAHRLSIRTVVVAAFLLLVLLVGGASLTAVFPGSFEFDNGGVLFDRLSLPFWNAGIWTQLVIGVGTIAVCIGFATNPKRAAWTAALFAVLGGDLIYALPYDLRVTGLELPVI